MTAPSLVYRGASAVPLEITAPALVFRGAGAAPLEIAAPALVYRGTNAAPLEITAPAIVYRSAATQATQPTPSTLEIIDRPTGPVNSIYLSLDSVDVDAALGMTVTYQGLLENRGYCGLIFMDETPPRLAAWFYTAANKPDGEYQRSCLPSLTGNWNACIGFAPQIDRAVADVAQYTNYLDFVVAGAGSIHAQPTLTAPEGRSRRDADLRWPAPTNCGIYIYDASGQEVALHFTNRKSDDAWTLRFAKPGTHDLTITYHGSAVRAHAKLEVTP